MLRRFLEWKVDRKNKKTVTVDYKMSQQERDEFMKKAEQEWKL